MDARRLSTRAALWALRGEPPAPVYLRDLWCDLRTPRSDADVPPANGLRSAVAHTVACRDEVDASPGQYLSVRGRLWLLDGRRELPADRGLLLSATELVGDDAVVTPQGGEALTVRAALLRGAAGMGELGAGVERRARVECCAFELPMLVPGDRVSVGGLDWIVADPVPDAWDGVTWQVWVLPA